MRQLSPLALLLATAGVGLDPADARAALIVSVGTATVTPGSSGSVQVLLTNTGPNAADVSGFSLALSLGNAPAQFTGVGSPTTPGYIFGNEGSGSLTFDTFPNRAFIASDFSFNANGFVTVQPGRTVGLADVGFSTSGLAPFGFLPIRLVPGPTTAVYDANGNPYTAGVVFANGGVSVTPEPASAGVFLLAAATGYFVVRRRRAA
jgi:MYXO-CTERM domain-containing protein